MGKGKEITMGAETIFEVLAEFFPVELLIMPILLWMLGYVFKQWRRFPDTSIIFALAAVGIVLTPLYMWLRLHQPFTGELALMGAIYGFISAWGAVYGQNMIKQLGQARGIDKGELPNGPDPGPDHQ
jgi:hypothetical protein